MFIEHVERIELIMDESREVGKPYYVLIGDTSVRVEATGPKDIEAEHGQDLDYVLAVVSEVLRRNRTQIQ